MTVEEAVSARAALSGDKAKIADLLDCCLNAKAALQMMGAKIKKGRGFQPVGALTLKQIGEVLESMPEEAALVATSLAFACEYCGNAAETAGEDFWICNACYAKAAA